MKKIVNRPEDVVAEMLMGIAKAHPELAYHENLEVISRKVKAEAKVGLVSGGGAGHEPAHAGYVGEGMLDAAVSGNVFASPSPDRILKGIEEANTGRGVLLIVKNYSGDIMNFEMAQEIAQSNGIEVEMVVVRDDVAVEDSTYSAGRRGIAGTVFVHKIAGAKAASGADLNEVKETALKVIGNIRSIGMAMTPCILPEVGTPGFTLGDSEVEIGMGIHGEPGVERTGIPTSERLAEIMVGKLMDDFDFSDTDVALMVNGLGGTPLMELYILNNDVRSALEKKKVRVERTLVGNYMTSLEMSGCSVTLLKLDDEIRDLLAAPAGAPAWRAS
jgi:dihydroxyacetone kinase-like protein